MEILYTKITQDLTASLIDVARDELKKGHKIYYIVPSSLSFEKEKEILERLAKGADTAVFDLLVTRFKQLPYYFDKKESISDQVELSQIGFSMLFRKVLRKFSKEELPLYYALQNSNGFLEMLVALRQELLSANLTADSLPENEKNRELKLILTEFETELEKSYANFPEFKAFTRRITDGEFDDKLKNCVLIVDGYTRFSAEEEEFIAAVQVKVASFIIGTYSDKKSLTTSSETVYADAVEMVHRFQNRFKAELTELSNQSVNKVYTKLTRLIEQDYSFLISDDLVKLDKSDAKKVRIWDAENQRVEVEQVAKEIRQKIVDGALFKNFTVLVGDIDAYEIMIKEIFELYEIPFFYAKEESMSQHPLIIFFESLFAIKNKNYQKDDIVNLLKTKVYSDVNFNQEKVDTFEYYVNRFNINGRKKFATVFSEEDFSSLDQVESLRISLLGEQSPLQNFLSDNRPKKGKIWVSDLKTLLEEGHVLENMSQFYTEAESDQNHIFANQHEQVWKLLLTVLSEFTAIFSDEKMKILEFLEIILSGMKNAKYRQIPANVDVVNVNDYELVEPRTNSFVYAIGLSQTNFPRIKRNSTLLSDEERAEINQNAKEDQFIEQINVVNYHKNMFTVLSLVNSATEHLTLSVPQILQNEQGEISPMLQLFLDHSDGSIHRLLKAEAASETIEQIANTRAVISTLGKVERELEFSTHPQETQKYGFWSSIFRLLAKENTDFETLLISLNQDIAAVNLSDETVNKVYKGKIYASVSAFEQFYNCEYQYFLENTLGLETFETLDLNSKVVGNFFHEVFEKLLHLPELSNENFDEKLDFIFHQVNRKYARYFTSNATARFTWTNLEEIVRQTAVLLKKSLREETIKTLMTESSFGLPQSELGNFTVDDIYLRGRIDRIDELDKRLGIIDYKSSAHQFNLQEAYDGVSLQFLTYLGLLKRAYPQQKIWGALYLQFKNTPINLTDVNQLFEIGPLLERSMRYEGLLLQDSIDNVQKIESIAINRSNVYAENEFEGILALNEQLYRQAGERLRSGKIAINPVMKRTEGINRSGNVLGCRFCPLKSICRFEANTHFKEAREIGRKTRTEILTSLKGGGLK